VAAALLLAIAWAVAATPKRPAWFTTGGPMFGPTQDVPVFGPTAWRRECLGWTLAEQQPSGEWIGCLGLPRGLRVEYRHLHDPEPWRVPGVPADLDAIVILARIDHPGFARGAVLVYRRYADAGEEVLLAAESRMGRWALARAWRHLNEREPAWTEYDIRDQYVVGYGDWNWVRVPAQ
jgi:hypothetical protein